MEGEVEGGEGSRALSASSLHMNNEAYDRIRRCVVVNFACNFLGEAPFTNHIANCTMLAGLEETRCWPHRPFDSCLHSSAVAASRVHAGRHGLHEPYMLFPPPSRSLLLCQRMGRAARLHPVAVGSHTGRRAFRTRGERERGDQARRRCS